MTPTIPKLSVFISWAGDQAGHLARGFHDYLPDVVNMVELFLSDRNIDKGSPWQEVLTGRIRASSCAIVCLTTDSLKSPWVAFEAGAISRAADGPEDAKSRIWTYLLGLDERDLLLSPYAAYQASHATKEETFRLLASINRLSPDPVSADALKRRFEGSFWPHFSNVIEEAAKLPGSARESAPSEDAVLAEILRTVRALQSESRTDPVLGWVAPSTRQAVFRANTPAGVKLASLLQDRLPFKVNWHVSPDGTLTLRARGKELLLTREEAMEAVADDAVISTLAWTLSNLGESGSSAGPGGSDLPKSN